MATHITMAKPTLSSDSSSPDTRHSSSFVFPTSSDHDAQKQLAELEEKVFGIDIVILKEYNQAIFLTLNININVSCFMHTTIFMHRFSTK